MTQLESDLALKRQLQKSQARVESDTTRLTTDIELKERQIRTLQGELPSLQSQLQKASVNNFKARRTLSKINRLTRRAAAKATPQKIANTMQKQYELGCQEAQSKSLAAMVGTRMRQPNNT